MRRVLVMDVMDGLTEARKMDTRFDGAIIDPPYNIGKDFGEGGHDSMPVNEWADWLKSVIDLTLTAVGGRLVYVYGYAKMLCRVAAQYPPDEQEWLVWMFNNPAYPSGAATSWIRSHEDIMMLWRGERPRLASYDRLRIPYAETSLKLKGKPRVSTINGKKYHNSSYKLHPQGSKPRDVITTPSMTAGTGMGERWLYCRTCRQAHKNPAHDGHDEVRHPTQKPMGISRKLVMSLAEEGQGNILVPFAGSGSECQAAAEHGLGYLAIEKNPEYAAMAEARGAQCGR